MVDPTAHFLHDDRNKRYFCDLSISNSRRYISGSEPWLKWRITGVCVSSRLPSISNSDHAIEFDPLLLTHPQSQLPSQVIVHVERHDTY
jgi:hypothetical protein